MDHLQRLAEALGGAPRGWHARLARAGEDPGRLAELGRALSLWWRGKALAASARQMRSPLYRQSKPLPHGGRALYTYERSLWPVPLESPPPAPPGWECETIVCRNLAAAYATLLVSLRDLQQQPVTVRCWGVPDCVPPLLDCLAPGAWSRAHRLDTLESSLRSGRADLYLVSEVPAMPPGGVLVIQGELRLEPGPWLIAHLQSWDARRAGGLELSRLGELRLYAPVSQAAPLTALATASELARRVRSVLGGCPSYAELWEWCLPRLPSLPERPCQSWSLSGWRDSPEQGLAKAPRRMGPGWPAEPAYRPGQEQAWLGELRRWRQQTLRVADSHPAVSLEALEARLPAYDQPLPGHELHGLLFSSAMAALAALSLLMPRLESEARYYETRFLHEVLHARGQDVRWVESVQYDWELRPGVLEPCPVLVLDTTLTGQRLRLGQLPFRPTLAVRVFSALKLDQRGQELENAGAVLLSGEPEVVRPIREALSELRRSLGAEPRRSRLSPPWVLNADPDHGERVLENNAWLARRLEPGGLLRRVVHPPGGAPFCVLHLGDDSLEGHFYLTALIERLVRDLPFGRGASFGFVDHRHEFVVPVLKERRALFKVAMGSSPGPSRQGVLEVLQKALSYPDLAALRRAHPGLRPAAPTADWSAPSPRLLRFLAGSEPGF